MKKGILLFCILGMLIVCGACKNRTAAEEPKTPADSETAQTDPADPQGDALSLRVIDGAGTGQLVLAGEKSGDLYTVGADALTVFIDGEQAAPSDLKNGMRLSFDAGYELMETWPMQIAGASVRAQSEPGDAEDHGDLCGLYLQVLEDLWTNDSGLNGDLTYISVDLDKAPGRLTDGEKAAVAWIFAGRHNAQGLQLGFEALKAQGYVDETSLYWEDGLLFSITKTETGKDAADRITFNAAKWRSGDGAIFFNDCTAKRGRGVEWKPYKTGGFAIS